MDGKTVIKILKTFGFQCIRINGSHHIMTDGIKITFPVPVHGKEDLKIGTIKNIEKIAGMKLK